MLGLFEYPLTESSEIQKIEVRKQYIFNDRKFSIGNILPGVILHLMQNHLPKVVLSGAKSSRSKYGSKNRTCVRQKIKSPKVSSHLAVEILERVTKLTIWKKCSKSLFIFKHFDFVLVIYEIF